MSRADELEQRVALIEKALNGRFGRLEKRLDNIGDGFRDLIDSNNAIVLRMGEIGEALKLVPARYIEGPSKRLARWREQAGELVRGGADKSANEAAGGKAK